MANRLGSVEENGRMGCQLPGGSSTSFFITEPPDSTDSAWLRPRGNVPNTSYTDALQDVRVVQMHQALSQLSSPKQSWLPSLGSSISEIYPHNEAMRAGDASDALKCEGGAGELLNRVNQLLLANVSLNNAHLSRSHSRETSHPPSPSHGRFSIHPPTNPLISTVLASEEPPGPSPSCTEVPCKGFSLRVLQQRVEQRRMKFRTVSQQREAGLFYSRAQTMEKQRLLMLAKKAAAKEQRSLRARQPPITPELCKRISLLLQVCTSAITHSNWMVCFRKEKQEQQDAIELAARRLALAEALRPLIRKWRVCRSVLRLQSFQTAGKSRKAKREACVLILNALQVLRLNMFKAFMYRTIKVMRRSVLVIQRAVRQYLCWRQVQVCDFLISWVGVRAKLRREMPAVLGRRLKVTAKDTAAVMAEYQTLLAQQQSLQSTDDRLSMRQASIFKKRSRVSSKLSDVVASHDTARRGGGRRLSRQISSPLPDVKNTTIILDDTELELLPDPQLAHGAQIQGALAAFLFRHAKGKESTTPEEGLVQLLGNSLLEVAQQRHQSPTFRNTALSRSTSVSGGALQKLRQLSPKHRPGFRWMLTQSEMTELLLRAFVRNDNQPH